MVTYSDAGVNVELGDDASKILYNASKLTWKNRNGKLGEVIQVFDDFSGLRAIDVGGLPSGTLMNIGFDGVGTKIELAERVGRHDSVAFDLFAMVCDDAVVRGAEPVLVGSILDVNSLGKEGANHINFVNQLAEGYIKAAKAANVAVVNGEVAELGARVGGYGPFNYNWGAGVVWFARKDRLFTGFEIKKDDYIVGLSEEGLRSNGLSLVRRILKKEKGDEWHNHDFAGERIIDLALTPSKIYSAAVVDMFGGFSGDPKAEVHGVVHVTGGGIPGKLGRVLRPSGLGANLTDLFRPSEFITYIQRLGEVQDREAYQTWNMGQGMLVITPHPEDVINIAEEKYGINAHVVGRIDSQPGIRIKSKGAYSKQNANLEFS